MTPGFACIRTQFAGDAPVFTIRKSISVWAAPKSLITKVMSKLYIPVRGGVKIPVVVL